MPSFNGVDLNTTYIHFSSKSHVFLLQYEISKFRNVFEIMIFKRLESRKIGPIKKLET